MWTNTEMFKYVVSSIGNPPGNTVRNWVLCEVPNIKNTIPSDDPKKETKLKLNPSAVGVVVIMSPNLIMPYSKELAFEGHALCESEVGHGTPIHTSFFPCCSAPQK